MKHCLILLVSFLSLSAAASTLTLQSGDMALTFNSSADGYSTALTYKGTDIPFLVAGQPAYLEVQNRAVSGYYKSVSESNGVFTCVAELTSNRGSVFTVTDIYSAKEPGQIVLQRDVQVRSQKKGDNIFLSTFGVQTTENAALTDNEYLVPGVLYKGYFDAACNTPTTLPQEGDAWFLYRDDRTPLPFVMSRGKKNGITITLAHKNSGDRTVVADAQGSASNAGYQFGSCGLWRDTDNALTYQEVVFPGTTNATKSGKGYRYHPVDTSVKHSYQVFLHISHTDTYAEAVKQSWDEVFDLYNPTIYPVDLDACYEGLIGSLLTYYVPCTADGGSYDKPGWPFEVSLSDFKPRGIDYQMGFVGMQVSSGYYLYRYGIENKQSDIRHKGEAVLNFWADDCLSPIGMPSTWYDPSNTGKGSWRNYESILRIMTGGMEGLLTAWCYGTKNGETHDNWLSSCKKFGDWLLSAQNDNGSLAFSWNRNKIVNNQHPVNTTNGLTTTSALRYLVELYIATGEEKYKEAALKAGDYCYLFVHKKYHYCACVVDNPQVIDSESGYMAMVGFLSLYDLTRDSKWLDAAEQAATYTETWVYSHEVPVEDDRAEDNAIFPRDRSIVGQHLIAIGHSAADLGFAWTSFAYYRLYLLTQNEHYLTMARMSAHNSKQSMNWDQSLYPGQPKGLQLEAFQVMIPRRVGGVATTLNWNYAGHLDPMFRFKDAFGTPDLEEVEKMSWEERKEKAARYALYQSSDYGQQITSTPQVKSMEGKMYPNPVAAGSILHVDMTDIDYHLSIYSSAGQRVFQSSRRGAADIRMNYPEGIYTIVIGCNGSIATQQIIVQ